MAERMPWGALSERMEDAVLDASGVDDVARRVLEALLSSPDVVRAGLGLASQGGRLLSFTSLTVGEHPSPEKLTWCEIDGMADVPLVRATLTGYPVLLNDLDAMARRYPQLVDRQASLGTCAMAAVPMSADGHRVGALLVSLSAPSDLGAAVAVLGATATVAARALVAAGAVGFVPAGQRSSAHRVLDLRPYDEEPQEGPADETAHPEPSVIHLPPGVTAPAQARRFLRRVLDMWRLPEDAFSDAELCLSELVTNAVIHTGTATEIVVCLDRDRLRVLVRDGGGDVTGPQHGPEADSAAVGGRGLVLVDHLAHSWSYERTRSGTVVTFEVMLPAPRAPSAGSGSGRAVQRS